jgi:hypothetical protein
LIHGSWTPDHLQNSGLGHFRQHALDQLGIAGYFWSSPNNDIARPDPPAPKSANTDREFTFAATIPTNLWHHREVAPYSRIASMAERWGPGSTTCAEQGSQNSAACRSQVE